VIFTSPFSFALRHCVGITRFCRSGTSSAVAHLDPNQAYFQREDKRQAGARTKNAFIKPMDYLTRN
jgi:hypothetical protein